MSFPRYPEYKDSGAEWLGEVPGYWEVVQFKRFVDIQNGSDHKHIEQAEGYLHGRTDRKAERPVWH
jgi:type I restriction enzyme S subunit